MVAVDLGIGGVEGLEFLAPFLGHVAHARDARLREQETPGVDVAGLDESLRLLRAAARVGRVDQPALPLHEVAQVAACPRQLLPVVVAARAQLDVLAIGGRLVGQWVHIGHTEQLDTAEAATVTAGLSLWRAISRARTTRWDCRRDPRPGSACHPAPSPSDCENAGPRVSGPQ